MSINRTSEIQHFNALVYGTVAHAIGASTVYIVPEGDGVRLLIPRGMYLVYTQHCPSEAHALEVARGKVAELRTRIA